MNAIPERASFSGHAHRPGALAMPTSQALDAIIRFARTMSFLRLLWCYIFAVSLYDIWLVYVCRDVIMQTEQNPVCRLLIAYDPTGLSLFVTAKIAGTLFVIAACRRLVNRYRDLGAQVTTGLACFQSGLLVYLTV